MGGTGGIHVDRFEAGRQASVNVTAMIGALTQVWRLDCYSAWIVDADAHRCSLQFDTKARGAHGGYGAASNQVDAKGVSCYL